MEIDYRMVLWFQKEGHFWCVCNWNLWSVTEIFEIIKGNFSLSFQKIHLICWCFCFCWENDLQSKLKEPLRKFFRFICSTPGRERKNFSRGDFEFFVWEKFRWEFLGYFLKTLANQRIFHQGGGNHPNHSFHVDLSLFLHPN